MWSFSVQRFDNANSFVFSERTTDGAHTIAIVTSMKYLKVLSKRSRIWMHPKLLTGGTSKKSQMVIHQLKKEEERRYTSYADRAVFYRTESYLSICDPPNDDKESGAESSSVPQRDMSWNSAAVALSVSCFRPPMARPKYAGDLNVQSCLNHLMERRSIWLIIRRDWFQWHMRIGRGTMRWHDLWIFSAAYTNDLNAVPHKIWNRIWRNPISTHSWLLLKRRVGTRVWQSFQRIFKIFTWKPTSLIKLNRLIQPCRLRRSWVVHTTSWLMNRTDFNNRLEMHFRILFLPYPSLVCLCLLGSANRLGWIPKVQDAAVII